MFQRYEIHSDKLRLQSMFGLYCFDIPFSRLEKVELADPPVFVDIIRRGQLSRKNGFGMRVLKNDFADLSRHVAVYKNSGYWRQIRITPNDAQKFCSALKESMKKLKNKS